MNVCQYDTLRKCKKKQDCVVCILTEIRTDVKADMKGEHTMEYRMGSFKALNIIDQMLKRVSK